MKTIHTSWKAASSDRDDWYNMIGTPVVFVRITSPFKTIRLSNEKLKLHETEGWAEYDDRFLQDISAIDHTLNIMRGFAGATGQMGQTTITVRRNAQDGHVFTDLHDITNFDNAIVEIWFCPKETNFWDEAAYTVKLYRGIVTNIIEKPDIIQFTVNEFSTSKHKKIPMRIDEFNEEKSLGWTVPNESVAKVVPICFGNRIFRAYHCDTTDNGTRYYFVAFHYIDERTSPRVNLLYWEPDSKRYKTVDSDKYTEISKLAGDLYVVRFDIEDLAIYEEMANYLSPTSVLTSYASGIPLMIDIAKVHDGVKTTRSDAGYSNKDYYTLNTWVSAFQMTFKKNQFDLRGNFDLYVIADFSYKNVGALKRWETRFHWLSTYYATQDQSMYDDDGSGPPSYYYVATIPEEKLNQGYDPNETSDAATLIKKNVSPDDLNDSNWIYCQMKALTNPISSVPVYVFEVFMKQVMLSLPRDFYIRDDFGNNTFEDAVTYVFNNFLNIASTDIVFENMQTDYDLTGQINEEVESFDFFAQLANEFGIIFFEDAEGKERFIDIAPIDNVYEITDSDVAADPTTKLAKMEKYRTELDVYSAFFVNYAVNYATGEYEASKYVTKDNNNIVLIDPTTLTDLCQDAFDNYATEKRLVVSLDYVTDIGTAERILAKLVQWYSRKRIIIEFESTSRVIDLEVGDQIRVNTTFFSSSNNFLIVSTTVSPLTGNMVFRLLETPWESSGLIRTLSELEHINEAYAVIKVMPLEEAEHVNETATHTLV